MIFFLAPAVRRLKKPPLCFLSDIFPPLCITSCMCACVLSRCSRVRLLATPWTVACQTSLSVGFSRQEYWSGLPCPSPWITS